MLRLRWGGCGQRQFQRRDFALLRLDFQHHRSIQRRRIELRAGNDGVALKDRARLGGSDALRALGPAESDAARARCAHPRKVTHDAPGHAFARRNQLARAARAGGQFAHKGFRHGAAHAYRKNPVPGLFRLCDDLWPLVDFAVRHQKDVRRFRLAQRSVSRLQGFADFRAAHVCIQRFCKPLGLVQILLVAGKGAACQRPGRATEGDDRHPVLRLHGFQNAVQRLFGLRHRIARHGAGTIHNNSQIQRARLLQAREKRLETCQRRDAFAILPTQDNTAGGLRCFHVQDEVAVHHRPFLRQRNHHLVLLAAERNIMRRAGKLRVAQGAADFHAQRKAVFHRQRNFRLLMRGEGRPPVAGRDRGRQEKAQPLARPAVHDGIAKRNLRHFLRQQIADIHGVQTGFGFFQHHRRIPRFHRVFILFFGAPFFDDCPFQPPRADFDCQIQQHGVQRQGKGVDRFNVGRFVVAVRL